MLAAPGVGLPLPRTLGAGPFCPSVLVNSVFGMTTQTVMAPVLTPALRLDGVSKVYYWQWFATCPVGSGGCMNYVGPRRTIP